MIQQISIRLTRLILRNNLGAEENFDWYVFGFEKLIEKLINYPILFLVGLCLGKPLEGVLFLLFFALLRMRTGGYHAPSRVVCTIASAVLVAVCLWVGIVLPPLGVLILLAILPICGVVIFVFAPINHPNLHLDESEMQQNRRFSRITFLIQVVVVGCLFFLGAPSSLVVMSCLGIITATATILLAKICRQEVVE